LNDWFTAANLNIALARLGQFQSYGRSGNRFTGDRFQSEAVAHPATMNDNVLTRARALGQGLRRI
jgi:hypothetical protein